MHWYEEVIYAEPTLIGILGATSLHILFWLFMTSWEFGLTKYIDQWLRRRYPRLYVDVIGANYGKKDDVAMWGAQACPEIMFVMFSVTFVHHSLAAVLMYIGMVTQSPWIWRHGLFVQLGGSDLLDFLKLAWCLLLPPGPFPTNLAVKSKQFCVFLPLHHSVSLLAGVPTAVYFADRAEFQFMGILLAGYPMFIIFLDLAAKCAPPDWNILSSCSELFLSLGFGYQRVYIYSPLAYELGRITWGSDIPTLAKITLTLGGSFMALCNLMVVVMLCQALKRLASSVQAAWYRDGNVLAHATAEPSVGVDTEGVLPRLLRKRQSQQPHGQTNKVDCEKSAAPETRRELR
eukprot:TRINITY_DN14469_c0_g1_i2.p1 TRINITY_DN14469_c0_g1~~TRINITY_DN14469_c0_g1_i2.p1  ORF type:complete len:346 (+),score=46.33 TRINITY_DN14469_c0_g1_i2:92-1129(+)